MQPAMHRPTTPQPESEQSLVAVTSPLSDSQVTVQRRRRKRIAIELPAEKLSSLNADEVKRWKNRIAAARARERTQKEVQELQSTVEQLWRENQQQKAFIEHLKGVIQSMQPSHSTMFVDAMDFSAPEPLPFRSQQQQAHSTSTEAAGTVDASLLSEVAWLFANPTQPQTPHEQ